jgi:hypothetical protein
MALQHLHRALKRGLPQIGWQCVDLCCSGAHGKALHEPYAAEDPEDAMYPIKLPPGKLRKANGACTLPAELVAELRLYCRARRP